MYQEDVCLFDLGAHFAKFFSKMRTGALFCKVSSKMNTHFHGSFRKNLAMVCLRLQSVRKIVQQCTISETATALACSLNPYCYLHTCVWHHDVIFKVQSETIHKQSCKTMQYFFQYISFNFSTVFLKVKEGCLTADVIECCQTQF